MADIYFDYDVMMAKIDSYMNEFDFLSVTGVANSMLGRNIPALILGEGSSVIAYIGGEEGCDTVSSKMLLRFVRDICTLHKENGAAFGFSVESILKKYTLIVIPMLNPDGSCYCAYGIDADNPIGERVISLNNGSRDFSHWRGNARGVELKYNYGAQYSDHELETEVGALCNFLKFGITPNLLLVLSESESNEGIIYFGEGESENKIAIALSQMTGMKRIYRECDPARLMLTDWAISELGASAFSIELPKIKGKNYREIEDMSFSCYAGLRKSLFCAPFLNKLK